MLGGPKKGLKSRGVHFFYAKGQENHQLGTEFFCTPESSIGNQESEVC
jgi:hypothetical protein